MATLHNIKMKLRAFTPGVLDKTAVLIANMIVSSGGTICGPIPLPKKIEKFCVNRSPHVDRKSMDKFAVISFTRVLFIIGANQTIIEEFSKMEIPSGVGVEISITKA